MASFDFPFKNKQGKPAKEKDFFNALSMEKNGFYPFGVNQFWHGGIHLTASASNALAINQGIASIADGEIIAYRINDKHIDTPYEDPKQNTCLNIYYSNSFVLVRHRLQYPKPRPPEKPNLLEVYSLYMHLLPWDGYPQEGSEPSRYKVTSAKLNMREDGKGTKRIARLPRGTVLELTGKVKGKYRQVAKIISGITPIPKTLGWVHGKYLSKVAVKKLSGKTIPKFLKKTIYTIKKSAKDIEAFAPNIKGVRGRITPKDGAEPIVLYPQGCELELEPYKKGAKRAKVKRIISGTPHRKAGKTDNGYIWLADVKKKNQPPKFNEIIYPRKMPIKKGELIGYMGQNCTPEKPSDYPMLHWEIFTGEGLKPFIGRARQENTKAKKSAKTILKIPAGIALHSLIDTPPTEQLLKETAVKILDKKGDYIKIQVQGLVATLPSSKLGKYNKKTNTFKINKKGQTEINGIPLEQPLQLLATYPKKLHAVLYPYHVGKIGWIRKQKLPHLSKLKTTYLEAATDFWSKYPIILNPNGLKTDHAACYKTRDILKKWKDENNKEWYKLQFDQDPPIVKIGYIDSTQISHHVPEEFIDFDGVDVPSDDGDGSYHQDPDSYYKNLWAQFGSEQQQNPANYQQLQLKPFAKKIFQFLDENHDGRISLPELRHALSHPIKQKKLSRLITKHQSEWVNDLHSWRYIEKHIPDETRFDWEYTKTKIHQYAWWDEVKARVAGFPSGDAFYFHPVGFVGNFSSTCFCDRDFTVSEIRKIIEMLRDKEKNVKAQHGYDLFTHKCPLPESERTYEKFTEQLNETLNNFGINTCLRKIHFLSQVYHETDRFRTTKEYGAPNTKSYDPYRGRGLMQLTHKKNYLAYGSYSRKDFVIGYADIATNLKYTFDSAGWYWKQGVMLSTKGTTWKPPSGAPSYVKKYTTKNFPKTIISYTDSGKTKHYGTVDLGLIADIDYLDIISWLVNGGSNGLQERRNYTKYLKEIFEYDSKCQNKK